MEKASSSSSSSSSSLNNTPSQTSSKPEKLQEEELQAFPIYVKTPDNALIQLHVSRMDSIRDIKQYLFEAKEICYLTSYHLHLPDDPNPCNDFTELSEIPSLHHDSTFHIVQAPYDERSARLHVRRLRDLLGSSAIDLPGSQSLFSRISDRAPEPSSTQTNDTTSSKSHKSHSEKEAPNGTDSSSSMGNSTLETGIDSEEELKLRLEGKGKSLPSLLDFYPPNNNAILCVKSICYSGWNPPSGNRRLHGDLFYLDVGLIEGRTISITAWTNGFYVNGSTGTNFDPKQAEKSYGDHTLVGVLRQVSKHFKTSFSKLVDSHFEKHPFEVLPAPLPVLSWILPSSQHTYDLNRAEDSLLLTSPTDLIRGQLRDWNEEYQTCKELPSTTVQERIFRDRALIKVTYDFVDAATKGAIAVIHKTVPPVNPLEPERAHMFIYNNLFFSYALDGRDMYKDWGGDRTSYTATNNDLKGVIAYNNANIDGLYTLLTAIIDYRGFRLVSQGIIPGLLHREQTSTVLYGSVDNGKTIANDPEFHVLMERAAKLLHIKSHTVQDQNNKSYLLSCSVECKGIIATDGRRYILDLVRTTPRDANFQGKHLFTIHRAELVAAFIDYRRVQRHEEKKKQNQEIDTSKQTKEKQENQGLDQPESESKTEPTSTKETTDEEESEEDAISFNPDVLTTAVLGGFESEIKADEDEVKSLSSFLLHNVIPTMLDGVYTNTSVPVDGTTLTSLFHDHGINMRYLGHITQLCQTQFHACLNRPNNSTVPFEPHPNTLLLFKQVCITEMVTRASKHIFNKHLMQVDDCKVAEFLAHFLNKLFVGFNPNPLFNLATKTSSATTTTSTTTTTIMTTTASTNTSNQSSQTSHSGDDTTSNKKKHKKKKETNPKFTKTSPPIQFTVSSLWSLICAQVSERFSYELPAEKGSLYLAPLPTLRSFCLKVGIQLVARDYDFSLMQPFRVDDLLDLVPVVKHFKPRSGDGSGILEAGKMGMVQGRLDLSFECLTEALAIFHQVYGPMHQSTATCYGNLAMVLYHAQDFGQALMHQKKAVIINERIQGLDHYETIQSYANLGLFCHRLGKAKQALNYLRRALYLGRLTYGPDHLDNATTYENISMVLQDLGKYKISLSYLKSALKLYQTYLGARHLQTAQVCHTIAIVYNSLDNFRKALKYEKMNYNILHNTVGDTHPQTHESNIWLKQFTARAVQTELEAVKRSQKDSAQTKGATMLHTVHSPSITIGPKTPHITFGPSATTNPAFASVPLSEVFRITNSQQTQKGRRGVNPKVFNQSRQPSNITTTTTATATPTIGKTNSSATNSESNNSSDPIISTSSGLLAGAARPKKKPQKK